MSQSDVGVESARFDGEVEEGNVLVVDDEPDVAETNMYMLEERGLTATFETQPSNALAHLEEANESIRCVVSDYRMPEMTGLELLGEIQALDRRLPFILFTGRGSEDVASEAIEAGADGYLQKGGTEQYDRLANRVEVAIERAATRRSLEKRRRQFEAVFQNAFDGVFVLDLSNAVIVEANPRACELLGYPYEELVGTGIEEIHPDDFEEYLEVGRQIIESGESRCVESVCYKRSGEAIASEITASTMEYEGATHLLTIMRPQ